MKFFLKLNKMASLFFLMAILSLFSVDEVNAASTQFFPETVQLEKFENLEEMNRDVKLHILLICFSPVAFLFLWYLIGTLCKWILKGSKK